MRSDSDIKQDVEDELQWDPDIGAADIGVVVRDGVVALTGYVRSYNQKLAAERDAKRIAGVKAVANDIEVRLPVSDQLPDPDIARDVVTALKLELPYSYEHIKVLVSAGWVTLEGAVEWNYQKMRAGEVVRRLRGVKGISNLIRLKPSVTATEIKSKIENAFRRSAEIDAKRITVEAHGSEIILKGSVRSWMERKEAERAAWMAPGVTNVDNRLLVNPDLADAA